VEQRRDEDIMQNEHRKNGSNNHLGNVLQNEGRDIGSKDLVVNTVQNENTKNGCGHKDPDYIKILRDIGIEKREGEPLTEDDLHWIYIYVQEGLLVGS
jgi:hypothetical protein